MPLYAAEIVSGLQPLTSTGLALLFLFLPGCLLWKLLIVRSERFREFCMEEYGFWTALLAQMTISVLITGWAGFVLGELGYFNVFLLAGIIGVVCVILAVMGNPKRMWQARGYRRTRLLGTVQDETTKIAPKSALDYVKRYLRLVKNLINQVLLRNETLYIPVLIIVALFTFTRPIHNVWRGRRDGADAVCGIALARNGGFLVEENALAKIPDEYQRALFFEGNIKTGSTRYMRFPSYFSMPGPEYEKSYPAFLHFHSTWLGISCALVGIPDFYYVTALLAIISIGVTFLFMNMLSSIKTAFLAILLLTLNLAQAYFVRFSSSVITAQLLVFAGLYFFLVFSRTGLKTFGFFSGISFGQAVLCGVGLLNYFVLAGFLAFFATYSPRKHARIHYGFIIVPFLLFVSQAILFDAIAGTNNLMIFAESLTRSVIGPLGSGAWEPHFTTAIKTAAIFIGILVVISTVLLVRRKEHAGWIRRAISYHNGMILRILGYVPIIAYVVWFYSTRPSFMSYEGGVVHSNKWIHKFVDELGLLFLIIGVAFFIYFRFFKKRHHMVYFPMFLFLIFTLENLWNPATSSVLPYGFRKFIPIFLPFAYFMIAYSLFAFRELTRELEFGRYFGGIIAIAAVSLILVTARSGLLLKRNPGGESLSADVFRQYEQQIISKLERADIPAEKCIFLFAPGSRDLLVPMTLTYVYDIQSVQLYSAVFENEIMGRIVENLIDSGKEVILVVEASGESGHDGIGQLRTIPFGQVSISIPRLEETQGERIRNIVEEGKDPTSLTLLRVIREI